MLNALFVVNMITNPAIKTFFGLVIQFDIYVLGTSLLWPMSAICMKQSVTVRIALGILFVSASDKSHNIMITGNMCCR